MSIDDMPNLPDREKRFEEITVDCYDEYELLSAFTVYLTDALWVRFAASWGVLRRRQWRCSAWGCG